MTYTTAPIRCKRSTPAEILRRGTPKHKTSMSLWQCCGPDRRTFIVLTAWAPSRHRRTRPAPSQRLTHSIVSGIRQVQLELLSTLFATPPASSTPRRICITTAPDTMIQAPEDFSMTIQLGLAVASTSTNTQGTRPVLSDPDGLQSSAPSQMMDLMNWLYGSWYPGGTYHSNDPITRDLSKSPAMQEIRDQYKKADCQPGWYCGEFHPIQVFTTANLVIQSVGSFCAYLSTNVDGHMQVDAYNKWGLKSLTANPWSNRRNPSLWDMLFHNAKWTWPSSILNNTQNGSMAKRRYWYQWTETKPCCGK